MSLGSVPLLPYAACRVSDVTALIDPSLNGESLQLIAGLINTFSSWMQNHLNRKLEKKTYTDILDGGCHQIVVRTPPIINDNAFEVWEDITRVFTDTQYKLTKNTHFYVSSYDTGAIRRCGNQYYFPNYSECIKVIYNGGLIRNIESEDIFEGPADLQGACAMQVTYWYQNRENLGLQSISQLGNWAQSYRLPTDLLPGVGNIVLNYRNLDVF